MLHRIVLPVAFCAVLFSISSAQAQFPRPRPYGLGDPVTYPGQPGYSPAGQLSRVGMPPYIAQHFPPSGLPTRVSDDPSGLWPAAPAGSPFQITYPNVPGMPGNTVDHIRPLAGLPPYVQAQLEGEMQRPRLGNGPMASAPPQLPMPPVRIPEYSMAPVKLPEQPRFSFSSWVPVLLGIAAGLAQLFRKRTN